MTDAPASNRLVVAAFDVDGTLTRRDCVVPYLRRAAGRFHLYRAFLRHPAASVKALVARDRDSLKAIAISALKGRRWLDLVAIGEMYASEIARDNLRDDTVRRLSWHRAAGHRVVLVSASLRPYLVPLGMHLGVDAILCCEIEVGPDGVATGRIDGLNCRGAEKVRRLRRCVALLSVPAEPESGTHLRSERSLRRPEWRCLNRSRSSASTSSSNETSSRRRSPSIAELGPATLAS